MKFLSLVKNIYKKFESELFCNHSCILCEREIIDGTKFSICKNCYKKLEKIDGNICEKCGTKIYDNTKFCVQCNKMNYVFDKNISFYFYNKATSEIIKKLKYVGKKYLSKYIAEMMTENLELYKNVDYITFVPIGEKRFKDRGFNQAEEIAKEISLITKLPLISLLIKSGNSRNQAELSEKERINNLKNCFHLIDNSTSVKNKNILIIDDVFTTGTTLNRCVTEIRKLKPNKVFTFTFAKTKHSEI